MSHRISIATSITDRTIAEAALKAKGWGYDVSGDTIRITSGPMSRANINLKTGEVSGDTDVHTDKYGAHGNLGSLNRAYSEQLVRAQVASKSGYFEVCEEVQVNGKGKLRLVAAGLSLG